MYVCMYALEERRTKQQMLYEEECILASDKGCHTRTAAYFVIFLSQVCQIIVLRVLILSLSIIGHQTAVTENNHNTIPEKRTQKTENRKKKETKPETRDKAEYSKSKKKRKIKNNKRLEDDPKARLRGAAASTHH